MEALKDLNLRGDIIDITCNIITCNSNYTC